jgi:endonuclease I
MTLKRSSLFVFLYIVSAIAYAAIPSGYYTTATGSGATLKTQLYNIINGHTERSYAQLWTDFQTTDAKSNGKVWDMYSDIPNGTPPYEYTFISDQCGNYTGEGSCYNREHSFPKSWFNDATPMYSDLFHLYPTDGYVNGQRGNLPFGEVSSPDWTSQNGSKKGANAYPGFSGEVFEPIDEYKGDFARTYFYMATRYENVIAGWEKYDSNGDAVLNGTAFPAFETWFLNMLGEWHVADPVSAKETARNDAVYGIQGNRNPFIDHPEYVYSIWGVGQSGSAEPANYPTAFSARNVKLQWTDAGGAITPEKYLIRMSATGFEDIAVPTDGVSYSDSNSDKNVNAGVQQVWFTNLSAGTYYFKIYGYTGSGATANYKTDGVVPQYSVTVP